MSKVNVLIPVYNAEAFIEDTLRFVLNQSYEDFDVLICDNASTDRTVDIIMKMNDPRIRLLKNKENIGMAGNWNRLIREADGDYLIIVCADDILLPGAIEDKAKILDSYQDVNIVTSASDIVDEKGRKIFTRRGFKKDGILKTADIWEKFFVRKNYFAEPTNNMLRRSAVIETGEFDPDLWYCIDWDYWLRILRTGNAYYINKPLSAFRVSGSSATGSSTKEKILKDEERFIRKYETGVIASVTKDMIRRREANFRRRLLLRSIFIKASGFVSSWRR